MKGFDILSKKIKRYFNTNTYFSHFYKERLPCTDAALHATGVLISPVCDESS